MTNIVMIAKDRARLTHQAVDTLRKNTDESAYNLTIVDDGSNDPIENWLEPADNTVVLRVSTSKGIVGLAKNLGVWFAEKYWGCGYWLYLSDNDVAFLPGWLDVLINNIVGNVAIVGGYRHPFHGVNNMSSSSTSPSRYFQETDAVAGYSMLMPWLVWDHCGPFDAHAKGVCQSEDYAFSRKAIGKNWRVGYVHPPVLVMCGLTNTEGKPAIGYEHFPLVPGYVQK